MLFSAAPAEYRRDPSGAHARPSHALSTLVRPMTCSVFVSKTVRVGRLNPLFVMTRNRPSGEGAMFRGKSPICTCFPAGAIRQPFGRSVAPPGCRPGHAVGTAPRCAIDPTIAMMQAPNINRTVALRRAAFVSLEVIERGLYGTRAATSCGVVQ